MSSLITLLRKFPDSAHGGLSIFVPFSKDYKLTRLAAPFAPGRVSEHGVWMDTYMPMRLYRLNPNRVQINLLSGEFAEVAKQFNLSTLEAQFTRDSYTNSTKFKTIDGSIPHFDLDVQALCCPVIVSNSRKAWFSDQGWVSGGDGKVRAAAINDLDRVRQALKYLCDARENPAELSIVPECDIPGEWFQGELRKRGCGQAGMLLTESYGPLANTRINHFRPEVVF